MKYMLILTQIMIILVVGCASDGPESASEAIPEESQLTLLTHDSFAISEEVLKAFEVKENAQVVLLPAGDAGAALNQAILAKDNPLADVFFGVDNTFLGRALDAEIFESYKSPLLQSIPESLHLDPGYRLLPVDYGFVCLNYDKAWFQEAGLQPPAALTDLTQPDYKDLLVVEDPATSSPGLAFLLATIGVFGTEGEYTYLDYWEDLSSNNVLITQGWEDAYYGHFSAASDGDRPIVVSYASSPPAEVVFASSPIAEPPTASVTAPQTCFKQVEFIGILVGTENRSLAEKFIDFALSQQFQEDIPLNMFVFPANENADLPEVFVQWAAIPDRPIEVDPAAIDAKRDEWIEAWTERILR